MERGVYRITGKRQQTDFSFDLTIEHGDSRKWYISKPFNLRDLGPRLSLGGSIWVYRNSAADSARSLRERDEAADKGFLFLSTAVNALALALDNVPADYMHGPFCSIDSGKGTVWDPAEKEVQIAWEIWGPGCI